MTINHSYPTDTGVDASFWKAANVTVDTSLQSLHVQVMGFFDRESMEAGRMPLVTKHLVVEIGDKDYETISSIVTAYMSNSLSNDI